MFVNRQAGAPELSQILLVMLRCLSCAGTLQVSHVGNLSTYQVYPRGKPLLHIITYSVNRDDMALIIGRGPVNILSTGLVNQPRKYTLENVQMALQIVMIIFHRKALIYIKYK